MAKITKNTTGLSIGTILKAINIKENTPFILNKFYKITDGDGVGALFVSGYSDIEFTMHELGDYFEYIASLEDIQDLESKALLIKQIFNQFKELSEDAEEEKSHEALINETIAFLAQDEVYQCDEIELRFICDNMDITMVAKCSCCGKFIFPDDECYGDNLNDGAPLCDHCSIFNEGDDMYQKTIHQDVLEKITGLKFAPHIGNVGSTVEEFNHWLNRYKLAFSYSDESSKKNFLDFINGCTEFNICDSCGLIEKTNELNWLGEDNKTTMFVRKSIHAEAICSECYEVFDKRVNITLSIIVQRISQNEMIYRVGDLVILNNVDKKLKSNKLYSYIESLDESTQTYKLKDFGDKVFKEEDFFDTGNEAYVIEYNKFIEKNYIEKTDELSDFASEYKEHTIDMLFENFGYKDEFIEYLRTNDLPYGRLLTPKNNIEELELEKQESSVNEELDETLVVKNELLEYIFCQDDDNGIVIPTYNELTEVDDYQSNWKLTEEYGDYSLSSLIYIVNEQSTKFFSIQKVLNGHKEKLRKPKKYGLRTYAEYGAPIEVVSELQELFNIYYNRNLVPESELISLQDSRNTQDFSSIEILLENETKYDELSTHLKSTLALEHHHNVDMLIDAIKESKADRREILHVYDC